MRPLKADPKGLAPHLQLAHKVDDLVDAAERVALEALMHHLAQRLEDADVVLFPVPRHPVDLQLLVDLGSKRHRDPAVSFIQAL